MNSTSLIENEVTPQTQPCVVLVRLQNELASIIKSKEMPFTRSYNLTQDAFIEISVRRDETQYHLEVKSANGSETAADPNLKKLVDLANVFTWRALSTCLSRIRLAPCPSMAHNGADEVLALYKCMDDFKTESTLPFSYTVTAPCGTYELFSAVQKSNHCELVIETNYVYGNSMKWKAEVEFVNQAFDRVDRVISDVLGEWLRPGGGSMRVDRRDNKQGAANGAPAAGATAAAAAAAAKREA